MIREALMAAMMNANKNGNAQPTQQAATNEEPKVKPIQRKGWEAYREYLDKQGLYGDKRLNTAFGKTTFINWAKANPQYELSWDVLPAIGEDLMKQKQQIIEAEKQGKTQYFEDEKIVPASKMNPTIETNLKSKNVWWPGTEFTSQGYTEDEESLVDSKGNVIETIQHGIITPETKFESDIKNFKKANVEKAKKKL